MFSGKATHTPLFSTWKWCLIIDILLQVCYLDITTSIIINISLMIFKIIVNNVLNLVNRYIKIE